MSLEYVSTSVSAIPSAMPPSNVSGNDLNPPIKATARAETVTTIQRALEPSGRRLVLLAADSPEALETLGVTSRLALDTTVLEDMRLLERRPDHLVTLPVQVWLGTGPVSGG